MSTEMQDLMEAAGMHPDTDPQELLAWITEIRSAETPVNRSHRALLAIATERGRQVGEEGFNEAHDDEHSSGELALAGSIYAWTACLFLRGHDSSSDDPPPAWPWERSWFKPKDARRDLVRAGALIMAELERLDRVEAKQEPAA